MNSMQVSACSFPAAGWPVWQLVGSSWNYNCLPTCCSCSTSSSFQGPSMTPPGRPLMPCLENAATAGASQKREKVANRHGHSARIICSCGHSHAVAPCPPHVATHKRVSRFIACPAGQQPCSTQALAYCSCPYLLLAGPAVENSTALPGWGLHRGKRRTTCT